MISKMEDSSHLFTNEHAEKERYMHAQQKWDWGKNAEYFFPWKDKNILNLSNIISDLKPASILDYGCGRGYALAKLAEQFTNINFYNYDPFIEEHSTYPKISCDLIVSYNALQHVEDQFYDQVVENLYKLSNQLVLIRLYVFKNHRPADWYEKKYSKLFKIDDIMLGPPMTQEIDKSYFLYGVESDVRIPLYLKLSK